MDWHQRLGLMFLTLLAFRIFWGVMGSATARFGNFVKGPASVLAYLRGTALGPASVGHSPIGGWSVAALVSLMTLQIGLGLVAQDVDGLFYGPLNHLVDYDTGDAAREWHELTFNILLALVGVHVAAILFYLLARKNNLITPMLTGRTANVREDVAEPRRGSVAALIASMGAAAALVAWVWFGAPPLGQ